MAQIAVHLLFCAVIFIFPYYLDNDFLLNRYARYLVLGMVAMALSLSWGHAGILNLGQAVSFGLGSYAMAMSLKLRTVPVHTGSEGLPDFMVWNNVERLPLYWGPFCSLTFGIFAGIAVPVLLAAVLGWFMFRGRITGVFVAIITLAFLVVVNLLIIDQQRYTGGFNGITDLAQLELFGFEFDAYSKSTYFLVATCLVACLFAALALTKTNHLDVPAEYLSHGQTQWLEIALLLAQDSELILLDEPAAGMTHHETAKTASICKRLKGKHTIIVVEHDMGFVREIGEFITVMHQGTVLAEGTADEISRNEQVREVYLGSSRGIEDA